MKRRGSATLQHDRLFQLINTQHVVDSLLYGMVPQWQNPSDLNPGCWCACPRLNAGDIHTPHVRDLESRAMSNGEPSCFRVHSWHPLASYAVIKMKLALCHLLLYVVYNYVVPKIIKCNRCIQLLQLNASIKVVTSENESRPRLIWSTVYNLNDNKNVYMAPI